MFFASKIVAFDGSSQIFSADGVRTRKTKLFKIFNHLLATLEAPDEKVVTRNS